MTKTPATTNKSLARADQILDGVHEEYSFEEIAEAYGLDTSFCWTAETFAEYVDAYADQDALV